MNNIFVAHESKKSIFYVYWFLCRMNFRNYPLFISFPTHT
nr:MAG TPA: hypothetical protein [Caudoviricetes sp.]